VSVPGTEFVFRRGFQIRQGSATPVETVIGSDSRRPADQALRPEHEIVMLLNFADELRPKVPVGR
jgi:hypothetical protein